MNTRTDDKEIWIGLANVRVDRSHNKITDADYAYVTVVGLARGESDFKQQIAQELSRLGFRLLKLEEAEKFKERVRNFEVENSIFKLTEELTSDERVKFSTFHTYS
jgi:hypothetical protein